MSSYLPSQRAFTDLLVAHVATSVSPGVAVGDGVAPDTGGWASGRVNTSEFVPYVVVAVGAVVVGPDGALKDMFGDTGFVVSMRSYGGTRAHADFVADRARRSIADLHLSDVLLDAETWRVVSVAYQSLGGPVRLDTVDPPYWAVSDRMMLAMHRKQP